MICLWIVSHIWLVNTAVGEGTWRQWIGYACGSCPVLLEVQRWTPEESSRSCWVWGMLIRLHFCFVLSAVGRNGFFCGIGYQRYMWLKYFMLLVNYSGLYFKYWQHLCFSFKVELRMDGDKPYVTDNSNYIIDLYFQVLEMCESLRGAHEHVLPMW